MINSDTLQNPPTPVWDTYYKLLHDTQSDNYVVCLSLTRWWQGDWIARPKIRDMACAKEPTGRIHIIIN